MPTPGMRPPRRCQAHGASRRGARARDGFALLATLWLALAIVTVSLGFALEARTARVMVTNAAESSQALAAARAGFETARSRLDRLAAGRAPSGPVAVHPADPWQWADTLVGERAALDRGGAAYEVRVRDDGALLNVNASSERALRDLFLAAGLHGDEPTRLAQAILDWRDPDDDSRSSGAERDAYLQAGRLVLPANRDFTSVGELRDVLGVTSEVYQAIAPYLAVGTTGRVSINTAPAPVLRTVPGFTDEVVAAVLAARGPGRRIESFGQLLSLLPGGARAGLANRRNVLDGRVAFTTDAVEITSVGWSPGGRTRATVRALVDRGTPATRIRWRRDE